MNTKKCTVCKIKKPISEFNKRSHSKDGLASLCRDCMHIRTARYRKLPGRVRKQASRDLYRKYGLTLDEKEAMLKEQGYKCAVCEKQLIMKTACVDHNHETGKIRGLLCYPCNMAAGWVHDDPDISDKLSSYLRKVHCHGLQ